MLNGVPTQDRVVNQQKLREVLPKAENLKHQLLKIYEEEYGRFLKDQVRLLSHNTNLSDKLRFNNNLLLCFIFCLVPWIWDV